MLYVGTSGWQYAHWRASFYPGKLPQRTWLEHFAERFQTVEVNNTFYNLPAASVFEHWRERTPDDFVFALKVSRFLTHVRQLQEPEAAVHVFLERAQQLGRKRGPSLIQLPPQMKLDAGRLDATLAAFPRSDRIAVEPRHESWFVPHVRSVLEKHGAALCLADRKGIITPRWRTADWGYVRFHQGRALPPPCYGRQALETWVELIAETWTREEDVYVYFNNDFKGCAIRDAIVLARLATARGLCPTRVGDPAEVKLGAR